MMLLKRPLGLLLTLLDIVICYTYCTTVNSHYVKNTEAVDIEPRKVFCVCTGYKQIVN